MRIAFDMSSVMWTCLLVGKDEEFGQQVTFGDRKVLVNSAQYGYDNAINKIAAALRQHHAAPRNMLMVFEGKHSKRRRLMIDSAYKETRDGRPPEAYVEFGKLKDMLIKTFRSLGGIALQQDYAEGDDVLAWLAQEIEEDLVIITGDGDLTALNSKNAYGATVTVQVGDSVGQNKYGDFEFKHIVVYKALVGDSSDNIKGCPGFGPKAFLQFYAEYGEDGLAQIKQLCETNKLADLAEDAEAGDKLAKKIYENRDSVLKSYRVAKLRPEWVNTLQNPLQWYPGLTLRAKPDEVDERLKQWYGQMFLVTGDKFNSAIEWARPFLVDTEFGGLDIETTTPEESDEYLIGINKDGKLDGVDVRASKVTGLSITFGANLEKSLYFAINHADTLGCDLQHVLEFIRSLPIEWAVHNASGFELPVLALADQPAQARSIHDRMIPGLLDTRIEANYYNENLPEFGLKYLSSGLLGYQQVSYEQVTRKVLSVNDDGSEVAIQRKMHELTGKEVLAYGCDDTVTCSALHNFFSLVLGLEHQFHVFREVEIDSYYLGAQAFNDGVPISRKRLKALADEDQAAHDVAWSRFREFLIKQGWEGTVPPVYTPEISPAEVKEAFQIVAGRALKTTVRLPAKLIAAAREEGEDLFAEMLHQCYRDDEGATKFTAWVQSKFKGEPEWKMSPKKKTTVMYEMLDLPVRLANDLTDNMRQEGRTQGNPKTDALAIAYALKYDVEAGSEKAEVLNSLKQMQVVETRQGLYYKPYPNLIHWLTDRIHPQMRQSATNTRRWIAVKPNVQQMSKHVKVEGDLPKVREVVVPHKRNAVVVSMDFDAQELRVIADYSGDENMVACFVGDNKKKMHGLTGAQIMASWGGEWEGMTYERFMKLYKEGHPEAIKAYALGKKVNFTTEYGAQAPKLAETLIIPEDEAQAYIDAKESQFPQVRAWKESVEAEAQARGYVRTMKGAVRHLGEALMSDDRYEASKALRQAVNTKVQSSSAEMTKLANGAAWRAKLLDRFDCQFYFPVHDENVWSCAIEDLFEFIPALHACMVQPFANMTIPVESSISFGKSFGPADQIEIGLVPSREAIQKGLDEYRERMAAEAA